MIGHFANGSREAHKPPNQPPIWHLEASYLTWKYVSGTEARNPLRAVLREIDGRSRSLILDRTRTRGYHFIA